MKKHLIIVGIICAASIPPAYAVTKCVKLTSSTTCKRYSGASDQSKMYAPTGVTYTDSGGSYEFTSACPLE